jgi:hypothetical protein
MNFDAMNRTRPENFSYSMTTVVIGPIELFARMQTVENIFQLLPDKNWIDV